MKLNLGFCFLISYLCSCKEYIADYIVENNTQENINICISKHNGSVDTNIISHHEKLIVFSESDNISAEDYVKHLQRLNMFDRLEIYNQEGKRFLKDALDFNAWHPFIQDEFVEIYLDVKKEDFEK